MERKRKLNETYLNLIEKIDKHKLIAVSKYSPFSDIELLYSFGHQVFGESRLQDLQEKSSLAMQQNLNDLSWHFIGHLQSKKVKDLFKINNLKAVHSVDSIRLLDEMKKREHNLGQEIDIYFQVNTSEENEKSGVSTNEDLFELVEHFQKLSFTKIRIAGLMTIGKMRTDQFEQDAKKCFTRLKDLKCEIENKYKIDLKLSMGMSSDYKWALEYGSDFIRIGSLIFQES